MRKVLVAFLLSFPTQVLADPPMVIERVVPPGATLVYVVDGVMVHTINVPEGRIRVTIELNPQHRGRK